MLFNILNDHFIVEIQISTLLGLKKFQVLCYCNTSCVLQSAKQFFYLVTSSVEISDWFDLVELPKDPGYYSLEAKVIALVISTVNIWSEYHSTHMYDVTGTSSADLPVFLFGIGFLGIFSR